MTNATTNLETLTNNLAALKAERAEVYEAMKQDETLRGKFWNLNRQIAFTRAQIKNA